MHAQVNHTEVDGIAKTKVVYEHRTILGFIGYWKEVLSATQERPNIYIRTTREYDKVYVNGVEYLNNK